MKNVFKQKIFLLLLVVLVSLSTLFIVPNTIAATSESENGVSENTVSDGSTPEASYEFISSDVYKFDTDITIDSIVDGNAFAFGKNITISGEIGGDVFACGEIVNITDTAYIHGSIFVCAQKVTVNGICYDIYGTSESFTLDTNGIIARDIRLAAKTTNINGQIKRNAFLSTTALVFADNASNLIAGNLSYTSPSEFTIPEGIVDGEIEFTPEVSSESSISDIIISYIRDIFSTLLYSLVIILLITWLAPKFKDKATDIFKKKAPLSLGVGLLTCIAVIAVSIILLFITFGLGIQISMAAISIFVLALTISKTVVSISCARLISDKMKNSKPVIYVLIALLVVLVISLLELIPYIGGLFGFVVSMIGLGIIVLNLISKKNTDNKSEVTDIKK